MAATAFDSDSYISLRSFKRDGGSVDTPVWCAPLDGKLVIFTLRESYKVKRVARNPHVQVAKCDVRGKLLGPWQDGTCAMIERGSAREDQAYAAFTRKYGLKMRIGNFFSSLVGRRKRRVVLEVAVAA
jgi:PPOX class probable F420-dependent enzyme